MNDEGLYALVKDKFTELDDLIKYLKYKDDLYSWKD